MVHKAELVGILLGIHLINTENKGITTCAIIIRGLNLIGKLVKGRLRVKKCDSKLTYNKIFLPFSAHL